MSSRIVFESSILFQNGNFIQSLVFPLCNSTRRCESMSSSACENLLRTNFQFRKGEWNVSLSFWCVCREYLANKNMAIRIKDLFSRKFCQLTCCFWLLSFSWCLNAVEFGAGGRGLFALPGPRKMPPCHKMLYNNQSDTGFTDLTCVFPLHCFLFASSGFRHQWRKTSRSK